ncbi:hypothetical protein FGB62_42g27 [Gracilaria domingensis]|nr:hypothetical protein FGB62_42g27 [Gracilaria domingensis]
MGGRGRRRRRRMARLNGNEDEESTAPTPRGGGHRRHRTARLYVLVSTPSADRQSSAVPMSSNATAPSPRRSQRQPKPNRRYHNGCSAHVQAEISSRMDAASPGVDQTTVPSPRKRLKPCFPVDPEIFARSPSSTFQTAPRDQAAGSCSARVSARPGSSFLPCFLQ